MTRGTPTAAPTRRGHRSVSQRGPEGPSSNSRELPAGSASTTSPSPSTTSSSPSLGLLVLLSEMGQWPQEALMVSRLLWSWRIEAPGKICRESVVLSKTSTGLALMWGWPCCGVSHSVGLALVWGRSWCRVGPGVGLALGWGRPWGGVGPGLLGSSRGGCPAVSTLPSWACTSFPPGDGGEGVPVKTLSGGSGPIRWCAVFPLPDFGQVTEEVSRTRDSWKEIPVAWP